MTTLPLELLVPMMAMYVVCMRDYTVGGPAAAEAQANGLVEADWFKPKVDRELMKQLMMRRDAPGIAHIASWFGALAVFGWLGHLAWGTWWALPAFAVYGVLYGTMSDSRWHECGHRTAFRTKWMNDVVYYVASFMIFREPESWRWSHARHHSDTIVVGRDNEIVFKRGTPVYKYLLELIGFSGIPAEFKKLVKNATGKMTPGQLDFQPVETHRTSVWASRAFLAVMATSVIVAFAVGSFEPLMYIVFPSVYGRWLLLMYGSTQHAGLAENVLDHRLNSRTVYMNPLNRWVYWNMNYHIEHHLYPSVPFHQLKKLHLAVKDQLPTPYGSVIEALREIIPAVRRQAKDPDYFVQRPLPQNAA